MDGTLSADTTGRTLTPRLAADARLLDVTSPDGNRVVAECVGNGARTVVVLPGGGQDRSRWAAVAAGLAERGVRTVVIDLRGHGDSDRVAIGRYELEDYARDVRAVLDRIQTPVTMAGHSMGGRVALLMAPGNASIDHLVLVDSCPDMAPDRHANRFLSSTTDGFASVEDACARMEAHYGRPMNPNSIAEELRRAEDRRLYWHWDPAILDRVIADTAAERDALCHAATRLRIPTMLVRTEFSRFVDDDATERFRARVPNLQVEVLPGTHHHRPWARPVELASLLERFSRGEIQHYR
jgi:pimeloyl-ACP methyl ester carboxylesterase